jgi:nucleoside-diphosphate-sugar epimerase
MRLANVLGVGDKKVSCKKNALQFFVREIVNNRPVHLYWPDHTIRDYIHVDDVCNSIALLLSLDETKNQIYNIGNTIPVRFGDCVEYVVNKTGNSCVDHVERSDFHKVIQTNIVYLDNGKIKNLGYKQTKTIWQILDELIEYYTREKNG